VQRTSRGDTPQMIRAELRVDRRKEFSANFLRNENTMNTAGTATRRDPDKPRDHLDVFREFIDHLERAARTATAAAQDKRRRANAR
jgi:hypothetical protein